MDLLQIARTNGPQKNVARSVTRKNVRSPAHVRRTARIPAIYAAVKNLARMKNQKSFARRHWKRGNVTKFGRNARRLVIDVINILISIKSFFSKTISFEISTNFTDKKLLHTCSLIYKLLFFYWRTLSFFFAVFFLNFNCKVNNQNNLDSNSFPKLQTKFKYVI